ncbi:hypothetical protein [Phormidesmis priestleyi]
MCRRDIQTPESLLDSSGQSVVLDLDWYTQFFVHKSVRFMKYEWSELNAYESLGKLGEYVEKVLKGFGEKYMINFA